MGLWVHKCRTGEVTIKNFWYFRKRRIKIWLVASKLVITFWKSLTKIGGDGLHSVRIEVRVQTEPIESNVNLTHLRKFCGQHNGS